MFTRVQDLWSKIPPAIQKPLLALIVAVIAFVSARWGITVPPAVITTITAPVETRYVTDTTQADLLSDLSADIADLPKTMQARPDDATLATDPERWYAAHATQIQQGVKSRFVQRLFRDCPEALAPLQSKAAFLKATATGEPVEGLDPAKVEKIFVFIERILPLLKIAAAAYPPAAAIVIVLEYLDKVYRQNHPLPVSLRWHNGPPAFEEFAMLAC